MLLNMFNNISFGNLNWIATLFRFGMTFFNYEIALPCNNIDNDDDKFDFELVLSDETVFFQSFVVHRI